MRSKPLWADGLAEQPEPDYDDVIVRVLEEEESEDAPAPARRGAPQGRRAFVIAAVAAAAIVGLAAALAPRTAFTLDDVPSFWGDVPMTCKTARFAQDERAVEFFWCRATSGESLPPGLYESPESSWTSDITRRPARSSRIRITPDGEVAGWATYQADFS